MMITPCAAVIGHPISHSLSPKLHGYWLDHYGLKGSYTAIDVPPADLERTLRSLPEQGFVGVNVTIPHKVSVLNYVDHISDRAALIGAVNTLTFRPDGSIYGDNTDGYGFISNLQQGAPFWDPTAGPAAVLGAGGASRAIVVALADAGVPEIFVTNRTRLKAEALRKDFGARVQVVDWGRASSMFESARTVVNTTSLGMKDAPPLNISLADLRDDAVVTDIVYNPLKTPFLEAAEAKGCTIVDGLGMLLHQGVPGFERWFGQRPEVTDDVRRAVLA